MKGYLQELDTVNFVPEEHIGELPGLIHNVKVKTILYSIFYDVTLSPNQVLDSTWFRDQYQSINPRTWPFILTVDEKVINKISPFVDQLILFLRRSGKEAFLFSSIPNGMKLTQDWGSFIEKEGKNLSDTDLITEAKKYFNEIVLWAQLLDSQHENIIINPYGAGPTYNQLYSDYLMSIGLGYLEAPKNRSIAYSKIRDIHDVDFKICKSIPDLISNIQYAINTQSRLIIDSESILEHKIELPESKEVVADIILDLNGILSKYNEIEDCIETLTIDKISQAISKAKKTTSEGWALLGKRANEKEVRKKFVAGLKIFIKEIIQRDTPNIPFSVLFKPPVLPGEKPSFKIDFPAINKIVYLKWFTEWKLRGLDKFINLRYYKKEI
jgi:hypothetical protein